MAGGARACAGAGVSTAQFAPPAPAGHGDPYRLGRGGQRAGGGGGRQKGHGDGGPADKRIVVGFGFWIFLLSDIIMFSAFFAAHAVLQTATDGGPSGRDLFDPSRVAIETACLLLSSFTCGLAAVATEARSQLWTQVFLLVTGALGAAFLTLECFEFAGMVARGAGPERSAFLSSFFALVGCHGLHVTVGMLWLGTMMAQIFVKGFRPEILRRMLCFNLFWHALDIIWVALFTLVYLIGMGR
jgi:cytochrome o ubiquinol oxidase subunit 3